MWFVMKSPTKQIPASKRGFVFHYFFLVGPTGLEPAASRPPAWRSSLLSYGPLFIRSFGRAGSLLSYSPWSG